MASQLVAPPIVEEDIQQRSRQAPIWLKRAMLCIVVAVVALLIHGYHPFAVDASVYVPAIKKQLHPELYPHESKFFLFPAQYSVFADLIADSVRVTHLPLPYVLLGWQFASIAVLLAACWRIGRLCLDTEWRALYGMMLMASLLTIPAAGTSLMLVDPYLTSRSLCTPLILMAICCVLENKLIRALLWMAAAVLVHPLMTIFGALFAVVVYAVKERNWALLAGVAASSMAVAGSAIWWASGVQVSQAYRTAVLSRSYFFLSQWEWYEILGLVAPLAMFALLLWYRTTQLNRRKVEWGIPGCDDQDRNLASCLISSLLCGAFFLAIALLVNWSSRLLPLARFQPLRVFHLLYVFLILFPVTIFVTKLTRHRRSVTIAMVAVVSAGMFFVQKETFPASPHVEWPWSHPANSWVQAFDWVRANTPPDALFAIDSHYTDAAGEDCQGFEALAERSSLPDFSNDGGVAALFPDIAREWAKGTALASRVPQLADTHDLQPLTEAGASWIVLQRSHAAELDCPYENGSVAVCRIDESKDEALPRVAKRRPPPKPGQ